MRNRQHFVGLWLDSREHQRLVALCNHSGLTASTLLRKLIMDAEIKPKPPETYAALLRELSAIGNNINQIAHWTNAQESVTEAEIQKAASLVWEAWRMVKDTL